MQTTACTRRGPSFTAKATVATLIAVPAIAAYSVLPATETKSAVTYAAPTPFGDGTVRTYVVRDSRGAPTSIGVELSESALQGPPTTKTMLHIPFPKEADDTQYTFVMFDWNPAGHVPDHVYTVPHFDFHFYMTKQDDVMAIQAGPDPIVAESRFVPKNYISPGNESFPAMGVHPVDATSGEFNGKTFDQTFIWGFSRGQIQFIEPMITKAFLETKPDFRAPIAIPARHAAPGYYPTEYRVYWKPETKEYRVALSGLVRRD